MNFVNISILIILIFISLILLSIVLSNEKSKQVFAKIFGTTLAIAILIIVVVLIVIGFILPETRYVLMIISGGILFIVFLEIAHFIFSKLGNRLSNTIDKIDTKKIDKHDNKIKVFAYVFSFFGLAYIFYAFYKLW